MTRGRSRALPGLVWLAIVSGARTGRADEAAPARPPTYPLVLLVQGDADLASQPAGPQDPQDPPAGPALRLRRVRVGEDVSVGDLRVRAVAEALPDTAAGTPFPPLTGGRLPFGGPVRVTEAFVGWAPGRAFQIDGGVLRVPFSLSRQLDEADLRLPERAPFADAFLPDFRPGVAAGGDLGALLYRAAFLSADTALDRHLAGAGGFGAARLWAEPLGPVGSTPWRRDPRDPWYGWFRFAAGVSVLYGTLAAPRTLAVDPDFQAQWRNLVVTAEYLFAVRYASGTEVAPGSTEQGAVVEPGVTLASRHLDLVARADWERAGGADLWGAGAGLTAYGPDPRLRLSAGFEHRWGQALTPGYGPGSYWAIVRLTVVAD